MSRSYARNSAAVSAIRGVMTRSIEGSEERLRNTTVRSSAPVLSNSFMKKFASSLVIPIAAKTTAKLSVEFRSLAWRTICAAIWLCGSPAAEKMGSF